MASGIQLTREDGFGIITAILLSGSAGAVDIIGYLQFDHVFVANMSGNTVLFASDLVAQQFSSAISHFLPIITFLSGVVTAKIVLNRVDERGWSGIGLCLILVSGLWTAAAVLIPNLAHLLVPVLSFSMGAQNASLPRMGTIPVNTAFITGNLEKLGEAIAGLLFNPASGDERLKMLAMGSIWTAYAVGAAIGALASGLIGKQALLIPASVLCLSAVLAFVAQIRGSCGTRST